MRLKNFYIYSRDYQLLQRLLAYNLYDAKLSANSYGLRDCIIKETMLIYPADLNQQ